MSGKTEKLWRGRAFTHYDQVSWLLVRVLEAEGMPRGDDRFEERFAELLKECEEAVSTEAAAVA
jgi:hypothetical protein